MLVPGNSVFITAVLLDSVLKFVVENSDEIEEDIDGVKAVVVMTIENGTMLVSSVSVMISSMLENSVLKFVVDNSDEIVEDIKWCLNCC
jgi:hypothetical protein